MFLTNHSSAFLLHDVRVVKNVACLSSLLAKPARHLVMLCEFKSSLLISIEIDSLCGL